jgi:predicted NACHT family NTPase
MIATVHRHSGALPGSRAELYDRICEVLLWRRQEAKNLPKETLDELSGAQKKRLMRALAFEMMRRKVRDLSSDEAITILRPMIRRMIKDLTVEELLDDVASNGLFIERGNGVRAFAHQTFQEYLAAEHIQDSR